MMSHSSELALTEEERHENVGKWLEGVHHPHVQPKRRAGNGVKSKHFLKYAY